MRSPGHRLAALALAVMPSALASGMTGCMGEELDTRPDAEVDQLRLGRVHVVLEPESDRVDDFEDAETFEVTARFAFVRGLEEDFVRARIDMPELPTEVLPPGACAASDQLTTAEAPEAPIAELQQLHLVDAGELRVQIGDDTVQVPLALVPDLLPYMSGVEYLYYGDTMPPAVGDDGGAAVLIEAAGSQTEELPPFRTESVVPPAPALHVTESDLHELTRGALVLRWRAADPPDVGPDGEMEGQEGLLTVRLTGLMGGEAVGTELTCVLPDAGQVRLAFDELRPLGLLLEADALRVTASRLQATQFDAGDFVGSELFVERREKLVLPLR